MNKADIMKAYYRIRKIDNTIPDSVIDFMKNSAIAVLDNLDDNAILNENPLCDKTKFNICVHWLNNKVGCKNCVKLFE